MLKICKHKILDRLSGAEKKRTIAEINASEPLSKLFLEILEERVEWYSSNLERLVGNPTELSAAVKCRAELIKLTKLFDKTTEE